MKVPSEMKTSRPPRLGGSLLLGAIPRKGNQSFGETSSFSDVLWYCSQKSNDMDANFVLINE